MKFENKIATIITISDSVTRLGVEKAFNNSEYYNVISTYSTVHSIPIVYKPDFLLFETHDESDVEFIEKFCKKHTTTKTVVFSSQRNLYVNFLLSKRLQLNGFIFDRIREQDLIDTCSKIIEANNDDTIYFPKHISVMFCLMEQLPPVLFTPVELEVLHLLNLGKFSKEIADILMLKVKTIENHFNNLKRKLNVKSIIPVILYASNMNYIPLKSTSFHKIIDS